MFRRGCFLYRVKLNLFLVSIRAGSCWLIRLLVSISMFLMPVTIVVLVSFRIRMGLVVVVHSMCDYGIKGSGFQTLCCRLPYGSITLHKMQNTPL